MENLRKRMAREIDDTRTYAITKFARDMLTATDSLSRALLVLPAETRDTAEGPLKSLIEGIDLTEREMQRLLAVHGVKPIEAEGQKFDPAPPPGDVRGARSDPSGRHGRPGGPDRLRHRRPRAASGHGRRRQRRRTRADPAGESHIDKNA